MRNIRWIIEKHLDIDWRNIHRLDWIELATLVRIHMSSTFENKYFQAKNLRLQPVPPPISLSQDVIKGKYNSKLLVLSSRNYSTWNLRDYPNNCWKQLSNINLNFLCVIVTQLCWLHHYMVQWVEVYPLNISSIWTTTKSITDPKKLLVYHYGDTMCRTKIVYWGTRLWPPPSPFPQFHLLISNGLARRSVTEKHTTILVLGRNHFSTGPTASRHSKHIRIWKIKSESTRFFMYFVKLLKTNNCSAQMLIKYT